jgi:succinate dehydrogenase hydrophobic anchor subunit
MSNISSNFTPTPWIYDGTEFLPFLMAVFAVILIVLVMWCIGYLAKMYRKKYENSPSSDSPCSEDYTTTAYQLLP